MSKPDYAFNYWVLSRLFSVDEDVIFDSVTEYNDKAIDCYTHYPDSKELTIIQNKYYSEDLRVVRNAVADFLLTPLAKLKANEYTRSEDLQRIFNIAKTDPEYKIRLCFFATTDQKSSDIETLVKDFNNSNHDLPCFVNAVYSSISDIYDLYYGKNYKEKISFTFNLSTMNKGMIASLREEYGVEGYEAFYVVTPVVQIYKMMKAANEKEYLLFDNNIRDFLGKNAVNTGIISTLQSANERRNFMYYNNGITIICQAVGTQSIDSRTTMRIIPLVNPQIVNGCQTANSIKTVLENLSDEAMEHEYKHVHVMLKALVIENRENPENEQFYRDVVKYTNKQNAIPEKAFASNASPFFRLQEELKDRGFLLQVKQSDSHKNKSLSPTEVRDLIQKAKRTTFPLDFQFSKRDDLVIPLEKLLQVFLAFVKDGHAAFSKKYLILKQGHEIYDSYTSQIHSFLTVNNMIMLFCLYKKAECEQKESKSRIPIPYYIIGFLGYLIGERTIDDFRKIQKSLDNLFGSKEVFDEAYGYLCKLSKNYRTLYYEKQGQDKGDYNYMIKRPIDENLLKSAIENANDFGDWDFVNSWVEEVSE